MSQKKKEREICKLWFPWLRERSVDEKPSHDSLQRTNLAIQEWSWGLLSTVWFTPEEGDSVLVRVQTRRGIKFTVGPAEAAFEGKRHETVTLSKHDSKPGAPDLPIQTWLAGAPLHTHLLGA